MDINISNLLFFNKLGTNMNLYFDQVDQIYKGNYTITSDTETSVGLIESQQIIIMEKSYNEDDGSFVYTRPLSKIQANITAELKSDEFFIYDIAEEDGDFFINKTDNVTIPLIDDVSFTDIDIDGVDYTSIPNTFDLNSIRENFETINIGFSSDTEGSYIGNLVLYINGTKFAEIFLFADAIGEDPKLTLLLNTLGQNIDNKDFLIFDTSDIKESNPDYRLLNKKRKELLLEFHNIFDHIGGYKSLINIIKYFGYEDLTLKEYWKNVDINSEKFNTLRGIDIEDIFNQGDTNTNGIDELFPSKVYKKTNKFGLFYQITEESGEFDEDGIPIVIESFQYTVQEILIKIFALKEKLKKYFLPFNSRIIDIVGEALYYTKIDLNYWIDNTKIDKIDVNVEPEFCVEPSTCGYIEDIRPLLWKGAKIGNDLKADMSTELIVREFTLTDSFYDNTLKIYDSVSGVGVEIVAEYKSDNESNINRLYAELLQVKQAPFTNYHITKDGNTLLFVERIKTDSDIISSVVQGRYSSNLPVLDYVDFVNGASPVSEYQSAYLGYFYDSSWSVEQLSNKDGIPVGYPITLKNKTFDITWDDLCITWNSIDDNKAYTNYFLSSDTNFPTLLWNNGEDISSGPSWDNLGYGQFYEMEWVISKPVDDTPQYYHTVRGTLDEYNEYSLVLPYSGKYTVELILHDLFGSLSRKIEKEYIEVNVKNPDFNVWKIADRFDATWDDLGDTTWDMLSQPWNLITNNDTTWNDALSSWGSIDNVEFYQNIVKQDIEQNSLYDNNPYIWNNLPDDLTWDDLEHLYWDELSPTFTKFYINDISGGFEIMVRDSNNDDMETYQFSPSFTASNLYIEFVNEITKLDPIDYPILSSFIWDYTRINNPENNFVDTVIGISKEFSKPENFYFSVDNGVTISEYNTPINGFGALGDAPCGFSIFEFEQPTIIGDTKISIDEVVYEIPTSVATLSDLATDLNTNSPYTDEWEFNIVKAALDPISTYDMKIIAYKKYYEPNDVCNVLYKDMFGTRYGRSITTNATWSNLEVIYHQTDVKVGTQVHFNYDNSKMPGHTDPIWEIIDSKGNTVIKYLNRYMSYLFTVRGEYSVKLTLFDTNGNTQSITKNGIINVI